MTNIIFVTKPTPAAKAAEADLMAIMKKRRLRLKTSVVVAVGGDGTLLKAIKDYYDKEVLFVGISAGRLGFMQTVERDQIDKLVTALETNSYGVIEAPLLAAASQSHPMQVIGYAFNDVSVERQGPRAAKFNLKIGDSPGTFIGDGIIFATPLGSTAYNLAAGGPIVDSRAQNVFVATPNNPHVSELYSSLQRPHVLAGDRRVELEIENQDIKERPVQLVLDGQVVIQELDQSVVVYLSPLKIRLIELNADQFHNRIENKRLGRH